MGGRTAARGAAGARKSPKCEKVQIPGKFRQIPGIPMFSRMTIMMVVMTITIVIIIVVIVIIVMMINLIVVIISFAPPRSRRLR